MSEIGRAMLKAYMAGVESGDYVVCLTAIDECPGEMRATLREIAREVFTEADWNSAWIQASIPRD